jgi:DNA-binding CsgD family transcriptional regulator
MAGDRNREIAATMHYAPQTVKNYLRIIMAKAGVLNRTQLAVWGWREGLWLRPME